MNLLDVVVLLLVAAACFVIGATVVVSVQYYLRWQQLGQRRLLPLHVWTVAMSYDLILVAQTITTTLDPRWWRIALVGPGLVLGIIAMFALLGYQRRRPAASDAS